MCLSRRSTQKPNRTNDDPLRLLYFGTLHHRPLTRPDLDLETRRLREWWYDACVSAQERTDDGWATAAAVMEWCLVIAAEICQRERRHRLGLPDDTAEEFKTRMFWERLETVGADLRMPGAPRSVH